MIGGLLKELVVQTGRYIRHRASSGFGRAGAVQETAAAPVERQSGGLLAAHPAGLVHAAADPPLPEIRIPPAAPLSSHLTGLRLDLGCGSKKVAGFLGIDRRPFPGVDGVTDLTKKRWVFQQSEIGGVKLVPITADGQSGFELPDNSVCEVFCAHFLEHLEHNQNKPERVRFMNELWRVMVPGGVAVIITPHWASHRAYGDFTHADKPVSEMFYSYLRKAWRKEQAPDNDIEFNPDGYTCDFDCKLGNTVHPEILKQENKEDIIFAIDWYKDAVLDLHATLTARK